MSRIGAQKRDEVARKRQAQRREESARARLVSNTRDELRAEIVKWLREEYRLNKHARSWAKAIEDRQDEDWDPENNPEQQDLLRSLDKMDPHTGRT